MNNIIKNILFSFFLLSTGILSVNQAKGMEDQIEGKTIIEKTTIFWKTEGKSDLCQYMHKYFISNETNNNQIFTIPSIKVGKPIIQVDSVGQLTINQEKSKIEHIILKDHNDHILFDNNKISQSTNQTRNKEKLKKLIDGRDITISFDNNLKITITFKKNLKRTPEQAINKLDKERKIKKIHTSLSLFTQQEQKKQQATRMLWQALENYEKINNGNITDIEQALKLGADINKKNKRGQTPLLFSLYNARFPSGILHASFFKTAQLLIDNNADINIADENNHTPLMHTTFQNLVEITKSLIAKGAQINVEDNNNFTALVYSLFNGHTEITKLLFEETANAKEALTRQDDKGQTPLEYILNDVNVEMIRFLIAKKASKKSEVRERIANNPILREKLQNIFYEILRSDQIGNDLELIKLIINCGADSNKPDEFNNSPLHLAVSSNKIKIVKFLIAEGTNLDMRDNCGWTALHTAVHKDYLKIIELLIAKKPNIEAKTKGGERSLHLAAYNGSVEAIQILLSAGADIDAQDNDGCTALHLVSHNGNIKIAELLIKSGADIYINNNTNYTPLDTALNMNRENIIQLLKQRDQSIINANKNS